MSNSLTGWSCIHCGVALSGPQEGAEHQASGECTGTTTPSFNRGDRVEDVSGYYGVGTVRYLDGDHMEDGSGRSYDWPDHVCVEFDDEIDGQKPFGWWKPEELRKVSA